MTRNGHERRYPKNTDVKQNEMPEIRGEKGETKWAENFGLGVSRVSPPAYFFWRPTGGSPRSNPSSGEAVARICFPKSALTARSWTNMSAACIEEADVEGQGLALDPRSRLPRQNPHARYQLPSKSKLGPPILFGALPSDPRIGFGTRLKELTPPGISVLLCVCVRPLRDPGRPFK